MHVLIIEDDYLEADKIEVSLRRNFEHVKVNKIATESEFREKLKGIKTDLPDLIVLDVMLRWSDPLSDQLGPPEDVQKEGFYRAGLRCLDMLLSLRETRDVPVIIYSVLERTDLESIMQTPQNVVYLRKSSDDRSLVRHVRSLLQGVPEATIRGDSWRDRLWESLQAKPGLSGFSIDLKRLFCRTRKPGDQ